MTVKHKDRARTGAGAHFASQDNFALDQLRLENLWLRQRLHALSKIEHEWRRARRVDVRALAA